MNKTKVRQHMNTHWDRRDVTTQNLRALYRVKENRPRQSRDMMPMSTTKPIT